MPIEKNQVVLFHYSVRDEQDNIIEDSHGGEPNAYLHGHGGIIKGLEEALEGRDAGDTFSVTVTPEKAYGPRKPDAIQRVPIKHLIAPNAGRQGWLRRYGPNRARVMWLLPRLAINLPMSTPIIRWLAEP